MGGDFNAVNDPIFDTSLSCKRLHPHLGDLLHASAVYDMWRCHHSNERGYLFFSSRHMSYFWIYFFLVDKWVLQQTSSSSIHDITWSEYAAISIDIEEKGACPKVFVWSCNNVIIQNLDNWQKLSKHLEEFFCMNASTTSNILSLWNAHKAYMRGLIIQMSAQAKGHFNSKLTDLLGFIHSLESKNKLTPT